VKDFAKLTCVGFRLALISSSRLNFLLSRLREGKRGRRAFLSYSHRDTAWGKWLHSAVEAYRIDKDLVGRETSAGAIRTSPNTIRFFHSVDDEIKNGTI
jgi:hypothetical protein